MKIALVVDGLESTRQIHADGGAFLAETGAALTLGLRRVEVQVFADADVEHLLDGLEKSQFLGVVFASNSMRHAGSQVMRAVSRHARSINLFLESGRGILVLHQYLRGELALPLPHGLTIGFRDRSEKPFERLEATAPDDALMNCPHDLLALERSLSLDGQLGDTTYWRALDESLMQGFVTVARAGNGDAVVMRSTDELAGRVVVTSLPADWHRARALTENLMLFTAGGAPDWVLWSSPAESTSALAATLGHQPSSYLGGSTGTNPSWLESRPSVHVVETSAEVERATSRPGMSLALAHGGIVISTERGDHQGVTHVHAVVGDRRHQLAQDFFTALRAAGQDWADSPDPFPLRNTVAAAQHFHAAEPDLPHAWNPAEDPRLDVALSKLVFAEMTVTSILAVAQVYCLKAATPRQRHRFVQDILAPTLDRIDNLDEHLLLEGARACLVGSPAEAVSWLAQVERRAASRLDPPLAIRLLDWLPHIRARGDACGDPVATTDALARLVTAATVDPDGSFLSVEGTANVVIAAAEGGSGGLSPALLHAIAPGIANLKRTYAELSRADEADVSQLARIAQALSCAEAVMPLGIDQLLAAFPSSDWSFGVGSTSESALAKAMTGRSSQLAARNRELVEELDSLRKSYARRLGGWWVGSITLCLLALASVTALGVEVVGVVATTSYGAVLAPLLGLLWLAVLWLALAGLELCGVVPEPVQPPVRWVVQQVRRRLSGS
ncbi:MAG: hypothetical protein ACXVWU_09640 [Nocardioides sp.]